MLGIRTNYNLDTKSNVKNTQPSFKGAEMIATNAFSYLKDNPMVTTALIDTVLCDVPKAVQDTKQRNPFAGIETAFREFSGTFNNCFLPGILGAGFGFLASSGINKTFNVKANKIWADTDTIDAFTDLYKKSNGDQNAFLQNVLSKVSAGLDSSHKINGEQADNIADAFKGIIAKTGNISKKDHTTLVAQIGEALGGHCEEIRFNGIDTNVDNFINDTINISRAFASDKLKVVKDGVKQIDNTKLDSFASGLKNVAKTKTALAFAVTIPIAVATHYLNRAQTKKRSGKDGAPIYKDFSDKDYKRELTPQEKKKLGAQKVLASGSLAGIALAAIGPKKLSQFGKTMQFRNFRTSLDQCRVVSTATFASRFMGAADSTELGQSFIRDVSSFMFFYVTGEFVSKLTAKSMEKPGYDLFRQVMDKPQENDGIMKKLAYVFRGNELKTHREVLIEEAIKAGKKLDITDKGAINTKKLLESLPQEAQAFAKKRLGVLNKAQAASMAFSALALGVAIPQLLIKLTDINEAKRKNKMGEQQPAQQPQKQEQTSTVTYKKFLNNGNFGSSRPQEVFNAFVKNNQ